MAALVVSRRVSRTVRHIVGTVLHCRAVTIPWSLRNYKLNVFIPKFWIQFNSMFAGVRLNILSLSVLNQEPDSKETSNHQHRIGLLLAGLFGLFSSEEDSAAIPVPVKTALMSAQMYHREGNYCQAELEYHNALKLLLNSPHADSRKFLEARAVILDKLANMYLENGKLEQALDNFKETMRVMLSCDVPQGSAPMVEISLKVAKIYTNQKKFEMAAAGFEWCVKVATVIVDNSDDDNKDNAVALLGLCLTGKGQFHLIVGNGDEALECFIKGFGLSVYLHGWSNVQTAVMCGNCATALDLMGKCDEACLVLETAIKMSEHCSSGEPEHMATLYTNLGSIRSHQGNLAGAVDAYEMGMQYAAQMTDKKLYDNIKFYIDDLKTKHDQGTAQ